MHSPMTRPESVGSVHSTTSDSASSSIGGRGSRHGQDICVTEEVKIAIDRALDQFERASPDKYPGMNCHHFSLAAVSLYPNSKSDSIIYVAELEFPSSLTATERAYIHRLAATHNLKSKSKGFVCFHFLLPLTFKQLILLIILTGKAPIVM